VVVCVFVVFVVVVVVVVVTRLVNCTRYDKTIVFSNLCDCSLVGSEKNFTFL
jgi:uncharacterized membrane protein YcfT